MTETTDGDFGTVIHHLVTPEAEEKDGKKLRFSLSADVN